MYALPTDATKESLLKEVEKQVSSQQDFNVTKLKIAEQYGFLSWRQLECYLEYRQRVEPNFEHLACLTYWYTDNPVRQSQAAQLLKKNSDIEFKSIHAAAAAGNVKVVEEFLDDDPQLLNHRGGYYDWEPLLYACYSRLNLPNRSTSDVVDLLLDRKADPSAYYRWGGIYLFSALTGICGEGERGPVNQPEHPDYPRLAQRLLKKGANCNDSQALYNRMFQRDNTCLELLLDYGLNSNHVCNWYHTKNNKLIEHPEKTLDYQLQWAVKHDHVERVKLLLQNGADASQKLEPGGRMHKFAMRRGFNEIAQSLEQHGAKPYRLKKVERFLNACLSGDKTTAEEMLKEDKELVRKAEKRVPDALCHAAEDNKINAVELMLDLGFNVHASGYETPIHQASHNGHLDLVKFLVSKGASLNRRDPFYCATPLGWAQAGSKKEVETYIESFDLGLFDLLNTGNVERVGKVLDSNPKLLDRPLSEELDKALKGNEIAWQTPLAYAAIRGQGEVVKLLINRGAKTNLKSPGGTPIGDFCSEQIQEILASTGGKD